MQPLLIDLPTHHHELGNLTFMQGCREIPFELQRVYFIYDIPSHAVRGGHAHSVNAELLIAVAGSFIVELEGQDGVRARFALERPNAGLIVPPLYWRTIRDYAAGSICLVLASHQYDPAEYIHDYGQFKQA